MFNLPTLDEILAHTPGELVSIKVICSFPYKWRHKQHYLLTGDTILLHKVKDREELDYLLSPVSPFPEKALLEVMGMPERTSRELARDEDYTSIPALPTIYDPYSMTKRVPATYPTQEAEEWNPHSLQTLEAAGVNMPEAIRMQGDARPAPVSPRSENEALAYEQPLPPPAFVAKVEAYDPGPELPPQPAVSERALRENELRHMNGRKMKPLAEAYGILWTTREEAIPQILSREFDGGEPPETPPPPVAPLPTPPPPGAGSSQTSALPDDYVES